jgi:hypothetical protein
MEGLRRLDVCSRACRLITQTEELAKMLRGLIRCFEAEDG